MTLIVAATIWLIVSPAWRAADGSTGLSLMDGRAGLTLSLLLAVVAGLLIAGPAVASSTVSYRLTGLGLAAIALILPAWRTGPIDGWIYRSALPDAYYQLVVETIFWFAGVLALLAAARIGRGHLHKHWPNLMPPEEAELNEDDLPDHSLPQSLAGFACATIVGGLIASALIHSTTPAQVIISLLVAFTLASLAAQFAFPRADPVALLLSPAAFAVLAYLRVAFAFDSQLDTLAAWYTSGGSVFGAMAGGALALPIHYASAGVAGCVVGMIWAQGWERE